MPHGLDTRHRTAARVAGIKAPYPGVDTLAPSGPAAGRAAEVDASEGRLAPVVHLADRAARPARDGATREPQAARIDAQNRINLGKALSALGWTPDTFLVAARENGHIVVRAAADSPLLTPVPVDAQRRLTLPPAVLGALDVRPGDQVLAGVVVDTAELHLFAAADALQQLIGALPGSGPPEAAAEPAPARPAAGGSRIRGRWQAVDRGTQRPADSC
ncbi:hypothetical protein SAMN05660690_4092 [Geodermatophilus telluris]|uniref:SpoVT-AbrB domain-containing protein n=1 Tax=Geodermatophilus telluris TaxID=1190417 RepID=A0A1G6U8V6_9ACTN|nr:hypothetical protein [Geodermatophilus telluris]SDD37136.1 hypothetical protein SAMN05660690_4092 [Geodermatophilus telluris]